MTGAPEGGIEPVAAGDRLRIAVLADFEGPHARSWLRWFIARGHDVHAISFYPPSAPVEGATMHALSGGGKRVSGSGRRETGSGITGRVPRGIARLAHAIRYRRAGLARVVRAIAPDVMHGHFLVEHGFYGMFAGARPYVATAWGSDVLVEPRRDPVSRLIAMYVARRADLVTSNNAYMAERIVALGAKRERVHVVTLGADRYDLERADASVNVAPPQQGRQRIVLSTRAHERLYNIGEIIDAYAQVVRSRPDVRLVVAHGGSQTAALQERARGAGGRVEFAGFLDRAAFRDALADAEVFVSVPSSDGTSVALLQAMAAGAFPVVSDLPTQRELIEDAADSPGVNGLRVPLHDVRALADRIGRALDDADLRRFAAARNRAIVEERGLNEVQMARMEELYRSLVAGATSC